ncbi:MAG: hypothetical protein A2Y15_03895 [Clostridiales bacterium GWF2_36_10]|nr:MAG: hypothetical protein A2Y15_03895 [Clostridiales bacterium GWF2_36_10]HAN21199.1 peroxiredoxin [Clostridiales bacterium]
MSNKTQFIIILLLIIVFIIGGTFAYNYLTKDYKPDNFISEQSQDNKDDNSKSDNFISEETQDNNNNNNNNNNDTAPDFTVLDSNGKTVSLSKNFGKPIIINFWATWCGPCQDEMPHFEKMYKEFGDEVVFMMVNLTDGTYDTVESVKKFIAENGFTFPVYFDTENDGAIAYGINSIPRTSGIDKNGNIVTDKIGSLSEEKLLNIINKIKQK